MLRSWRKSFSFPFHIIDMPFWFEMCPLISCITEFYKLHAIWACNYLLLLAFLFIHICFIQFLLLHFFLFFLFLFCIFDSLEETITIIFNLFHGLVHNNIQNNLHCYIIVLFTHQIYFPVFVWFNVIDFCHNFSFFLRMIKILYL